MRERNGRTRDGVDALLSAALAAAVLLAIFAVDPAFFWKDDFQLQYLPGSRDVVRAWSEGVPPLLSPHSWFSAGLGAEYQYGVFSFARLATEAVAWSLPVSLEGRAAFLFIVHAMLLGAGAHLLARRFGATRGAAVMCALAAALNGHLLWWGTTWYTTIASMAWLPWYWLALRAIPHRRFAWLGASAALYLLVAAGWPYTVLMAAAVGAFELFSALAERRVRNAIVLAASSAAGLAIAAPAAAMLIEYFRTGARMNIATRFEDLWVVPPVAFLGLILPTFATEWNVFSARLPHVSMELAGAFAPMVCIAGALFVMRGRFVRENRGLLLFLAALVALLLLPGAGPFRWSFRWLPLFHLVLALCGARALTAISDTRRVLPIAAGVMVAVVTAIAVLCDSNFAMTLTLAMVLLLGALLWLVLPGRICKAMPAALTAISILLMAIVFVPVDDVPRWKITDEVLVRAPFEESRLYFGAYDFRDVIARDAEARLRIGNRPELRPGNLPMLAGLHFVNGYSPIRPAGIAAAFHMDTHGPVPGSIVGMAVAGDTVPGALFDHMGVDGLVLLARDFVTHRLTLARNGWFPVGQTGEAVVVHRATPARYVAKAVPFAIKAGDDAQVQDALIQREGPFPLLLAAGAATPGEARYAPRELRDAKELRLRSEVVIAPGPGPALIVFGRAWVPGWRASLDGRALPVLTADAMMPAVEIPSGAGGKLVLDYRPASLVNAGALSLLAILVIAAASVRTLFSKT